MKHFIGKTIKPHRGFTLFELLVALFVLSIGLLGYAALQSQALRAGTSASHRTIATFLAADLADRMRSTLASNVSYSGNVAGDFTINTTSGGIPSDPGCGSSCSQAQRAAQDAFDWVNALQNQLPAGQAIVAAEPTATGMFLVTIMWDDERQGGLGTNCSGDPATDLTCFHTVIQI